LGLITITYLKAEQEIKNPLLERRCGVAKPAFQKYFVYFLEHSKAIASSVPIPLICGICSFGVSAF